MSWLDARALCDTVLPSTDQLYGPTGVAVSPDDAVLFVTNGNSELRYNAGTISVFDLERIDEAIDAAPTSPTRNRVVLKLGEPKPP